MAARSKSGRIQTVVRLANHEVEAAARALAEARRQVEAQMRQLKVLEDYRADYARRLQEQGGGGMSMARLADYRAFLHRLDGAIRQQQHRVGEARGEVDRLAEAWRKARLHHRSMDRYHQRCLREEQRRVQRKEQLESDERAQHRRGITGSGPSRG
ncbi:MAG TPA: flagellar export protein FliJ [Gammaproteobacteria bacterium]|nr:flagellar export protein FliJ [Gammaproteobacteria bacterium]